MKLILWLGILCVALSLGLGVIIMTGSLRAADVAIFDALAMTRQRTPDWAIATAALVTSLGDPDRRSLFVVVVLALLICQRCWRSSVIYLASVGFSIAGHSIAKEVFARPRPMLVPQLDQVTNLSYPSGHAAGAMVIVLLGAMLVGGRRWLVAALLVAIAIGVTRVMLSVHWPSDVVGGWLFGGGFALIGAAIAQSIERPQSKRLQKTKR